LPGAAGRYPGKQTAAPGWPPGFASRFLVISQSGMISKTGVDPIPTGFSALVIA